MMGAKPYFIPMLEWPREFPLLLDEEIDIELGEIHELSVLHRLIEEALILPEVLLPVSLGKPLQILQDTLDTFL